MARITTHPFIAYTENYLDCTRCHSIKRNVNNGKQLLTHANTLPNMKASERERERCIQLPTEVELKMDTDVNMCHIFNDRQKYLQLTDCFTAKDLWHFRTSWFKLFQNSSSKCENSTSILLHSPRVLFDPDISTHRFYMQIAKKQCARWKFCWFLTKFDAQQINTRKSFAFRWVEKWKFENQKIIKIKEDNFVLWSSYTFCFKQQYLIHWSAGWLLKSYSIIK